MSEILYILLCTARIAIRAIVEIAVGIVVAIIIIVKTEGDKE